MSIGDPATAPKRADLTFLRRRSKPRPAPAPPASPAASGPSIDYTRHDRARPASPAPSAPATPATGRPTIDFSRPARRPSAPPAAPASSGSLDLSSASPAAAAPAPRRPSRPPLNRHRDVRIAASEQVLLSVQRPTVTLTRLQSGAGHLTIEAVCSAEIGDLRLGALYQFRSGGSSTVQLAGGNRFAPSSRRPVIVASREEYERLGIDLRQIRDIERISVYAFSESRTPIDWGGTLVLDTFGKGRVELPLETLYQSSVAVLMSLYNLDGELVIRAEMESIVGDVREAARAYGYDRITWRDDRTPVD